MIKKSDLPAHVVAMAMSLAAQRGWRRVSLAEIAAESGLSLGELYALYPSKSNVLGALIEQIDQNMLAAAARDPNRSEESPRDRLFDVLMARFDAMQPYKEGIASVLRDQVADPVCGPLATIYWGNRLLRSMRWALEAAGVRSSGVLGAVRAKALLALYATVMPVWLRDDSEDMAKTMACLDKQLGRAEWLARFCADGRVRESAGGGDQTGAGTKGKSKTSAKGKGGPRSRPAPA